MAKLLVVDDELFTREGIMENLPWNDFGIDQIEQADDGVSGLELAAQLKPDIVLTDVRMPNMDGIEMAFKLREQFPYCKFIFMSGYSDKEYLKSAIDLQAISYVEKPINLDILKASIHSAAALCMDEEKKRQEETRINQRLLAGIPLIKSELSLQLIDKYMNYDNVRKLLEYACIDISSESNFVTILFNMTRDAGLPSIELNIERNEVFRIIEKLLAQCSLDGIYGFMESNQFILHLYNSSEKEPSLNRSSIKSFCLALSENLEGVFHYFFSIGRVVKGFTNIHESYQTAELTTQRAFFHEYKSIIFYDFIEGKSYQFNEIMLTTFANFILQNEKELAVSYIHQLSSDLRKHQNTPTSLIKDFYSKLLYRLVKAAEENHITFLNNSAEINTVWKSIYMLRTLNDLEQFVIQKTEAYFQAFEALKKNNDTIESVLHYIHVNYPKESLSITEISRNICLSPNYMCVLFKEKTNKTINQYITEYRIEESKSLLKDIRLKVCDVASKVGYNGGSYFKKVFKKITGLTPSEYRKRHLS